MQHDDRITDTGTVLASYLTEDNFAAELNRTRKTVRQWRRLGQGPAPTIIGKDVFYHIDDINAWLKGQRREVA